MSIRRLCVSTKDKQPAREALADRLRTGNGQIAKIRCKKRTSTYFPVSLT